MWTTSQKLQTFKEWKMIEKDPVTVDKISAVPVQAGKHQYK